MHQLNSFQKLIFSCFFMQNSLNKLGNKSVGNPRVKPATFPTPSCDKSDVFLPFASAPSRESDKFNESNPVIGCPSFFSFIDSTPTAPHAFSNSDKGFLCSTPSMRLSSFSDSTP